MLTAEMVGEDDGGAGGKNEGGAVAVDGSEWCMNGLSRLVG